MSTIFRCTSPLRIEAGMYEYASAKTVDFSEIPVISVANISRPDQLHNCGEAIVKAAGNVGFFYIVDHGIS
ncbi:MAG: 2-oxoglutarate and iron-dependent oxygenase domain-containing protein, partial [Candidatus Puniceispirillaceae bacterium]